MNSQFNHPTPLFDRDHITELLPQRDPMVMVDAFYGITGGVSLAGLEVCPDNIFLEGECLSAEGLMEHMAQAAAARAGYEARRRGEPVRLGFIGSINGATFGRSPRVGERILTRVVIVEQVMNIDLVEITARIGDEPVASCRMKIFTEN